MLELQNISLKLPDQKEILKQIDLQLEDKKFIVVTGPNGGGKTTLAKVISGITWPTKGRVLLDGKDISNMGITERAQLGICYAFQQPVRFKGITVRDLLELAAGRQLEEAKLCDYLIEVGLCAQDYMDREIDSSLSGGEIKRIEIATALARNARLTIFDEPEAGIDLWSFSMLIRKFEEIHKEKKQSLIVISHQEKIISMADRIMVIDDGKIKAEGRKEDVLPCLEGLDKCHACAGNAGVRA